MFLENSTPKWKLLKKPKLFCLTCEKCLKVQKVQGAFVKEVFGSCEIVNNLINLKDNRDNSGNEITLQLSNASKICTEIFTFLGMANIERDRIRKQKLPKLFLPKLLSLAKD